MFLEYAQLIVIIVIVAVIVIYVMVHYEGLSAFIRWLPREHLKPRLRIATVICARA